MRKPASSSRASIVGTSETIVARLSANRWARRSASKGGGSSIVVQPCTEPRIRIIRPPTWLSGSGHSQRSSAPSPRARAPPVGAGAQIPVRERDLTRFGGRSRREEDQRGVVVAEARGRERLGRLGQALLDHEAGRARALAAVGLGQAQVERHRGRARQQAGVQRHREVDPGRQRERDAVAAPNARVAEMCGGAARPPFELAVADALTRDVERRALAVAAGGERQPGLVAHFTEASLPAVSVTWTTAGEFEDIRYETSGDGIAKITIDRPEVRNAFRPQTIDRALARLRARS